jgi:virginiamycin B lyase
MDSGIASRGSAGYFPKSFDDFGAFEPRITLGGDGALWFTEPGNGKVGRMTTVGTLTAYDLGASTFPLGITAGPGHTIWFAEYGANRIGRFDEVVVSPWITDKLGGLSPDMVFASRDIPPALHFILVGPGLGSTGAVPSMTFTHDVSPTSGATLDPVVPSSPKVSLGASKVVTHPVNSTFPWEVWKQVFDLELPRIGLAVPHP